MLLLTNLRKITIIFSSRRLRKTNLVNVVNVIKGVSARRLRQEFPATKNLLCGDSFWSPSYFLATSGQVSLDALKEYVDSQMKK